MLIIGGNFVKIRPVDPEAIFLKWFIWKKLTRLYAFKPLELLDRSSPIFTQRNWIFEAVSRCRFL